MGRPLLAVLALWGCGGDLESKPTGETGEPADTDTDADADADADTDTDADTDADAFSHPREPGPCLEVD